jgi:hypothetical protein
MIVLQDNFIGTEWPLQYPRVGWRRVAGTVAASTSADGFAAANAATARTDSFWRPTALPADWTLTFGAASVVSYVGIAAHTIGTSGATVRLQRWTGSAYVDIPGTSHTPTDDSPILWLLTAAEQTRMRVAITGTTAPLVGVIYIGAVTEWPRLATYSPSVSFERAVNTSFDLNVTDGGSWAGRSITRKRTSPQMQVDHLPEEWINTEFAEFAAASLSQPFFIADRPGRYPRSVAYAWTDGDLIPERTAAKSSIANSVTLSLQGYRAR